jgi:formate dehydrogenase iron-sulfur subunit
MARPEPLGFFTDTTLCIGCKACEVACHEWNQLPAINGGANTLSGDSYDNTRQLDGINWRHVKFVEQFSEDRQEQSRWLLMSDVCKHCVQAGCLEVRPTGAIIRTEFDTVVIQSDVCNGCRACIAACPFDVIGINDQTNTAMKCTLCYDRMQNGLTPACAQACPTASIQFGPIRDLRPRAQQRVEHLHREGRTDAYLYGVPGDGYTDRIGGLNAFFLLLDTPEAYRLPATPQLPTRNQPGGWLLAIATAIVGGLLALVNFRRERMAALARGVPDSPPEEV